MNNRKQKINSILDSLTSKEIEQYLSERKINKKKTELLQILQKNKDQKGELTHLQKLFSEVINYQPYEKMFDLGQANVIAMIFHYGLHKDFTMKEFIKGMRNSFDDNQRLKNFVYDIMKDLN